MEPLLSARPDVDVTTTRLRLSGRLTAVRACTRSSYTVINMNTFFVLGAAAHGQGAVALIQTDADTMPGWLTLLIYLVPAAVALGLIVALLRRRGRGRDGQGR